MRPPIGVVSCAAGAMILAACAAGPRVPAATNPVACLPADAEPLPTPDVGPRVVNRSEVASALVRMEAELARLIVPDGRAEFCVLVDQTGERLASHLLESSGLAQIDRAASRVVDQIRFEPPTRASQPVRAWIVLPVSYTRRAGGTR